MRDSEDTGLYDTGTILARTTPLLQVRLVNTGAPASGWVLSAQLNSSNSASTFFDCPEFYLTVLTPRRYAAIVITLIRLYQVCFLTNL